MRAFTVFCKKEFTESVRTYKFAILLAVFVLLGVMSPMTAKIMPDIIGSMDLNGIKIELPEPTPADAWAQFFKNVGQIGMLIVAIVFSGIMANEFSRGTLINLLTKGLRRDTVILAKFTAATLIWTLAYILCLGVTAAYIVYYWGIDVHSPVLAFSGLWLFGEMLIALLIFGGILFANFYGSLAVAGGVIIALNLVEIAPKTAKYNPTSLAGGTLALLIGEKNADEFVPAIIVTIAVIALLIVASAVVFGRKRV